MELPLIQNSVALIGHALLACACVLWLNRSRRSPKVDRLLAAGAALVLLVPVGGLAWAGYVRGIMGDLSITSMILLGAFVAHRLADRQILSASSRSALLAGAAIGALLLYPMALGLGSFDPYRLGYRSIWFIFALAVMVVFTWHSRRGFAATVLAAVTAFNLNLLESTNLWDYLLDVWLAIGAWIWGAAALFRKFRRRVVEPEANHGELARPGSSAPSAWSEGDADDFSKTP